MKPGFFPLDEQLQLGPHGWTPGTVKHMVKLGVEIPSYGRAAQNYVELTAVGVSKSQLGELAKRYGGKIVQQQAVEAETMVQAPAGDEIIVPRDMPHPDSEVMAVSMDGAMVNIRGEGQNSPALCNGQWPDCAMLWPAPNHRSWLHRVECTAHNNEWPGPTVRFLRRQSPGC